MGKYCLTTIRQIRRVLILMLVFILRFYHYVISPLLGARCRFFPSCSQYACVALERYGIIRGGWLALKRVLRCHPFHSGGIDPVPETLEKIKKS